MPETIDKTFNQPKHLVFKAALGAIAQLEYFVRKYDEASGVISIETLTPEKIAAMVIEEEQESDPNMKHLLSRRYFWQMQNLTCVITQKSEVETVVAIDGINRHDGPVTIYGWWPNAHAVLGKMASLL